MPSFSLPFLGIIFAIIFGISFTILSISLFTNVIFTIKAFYLPKIFMPSILLFVASFTSSGGGIGSYASEITNIKTVNRKLNKLEEINLRKFSSFFMLIMCILFLPSGLNNIFSLKEKIYKSQKYCELNNGKSIGHEYLKFLDQRDELKFFKNQTKFIFENGLSCLEQTKCIKLNLFTDSYICNNNLKKNFTNLSEEINCLPFLSSEISNFSNEKEYIKLFVSSCLEKDKNFTNKIYKFITKDNLELTNSQNDTVLIEKIYNERMNNYKINNSNINEYIDSYNGTEYTYDLECFSKNDYRVCNFLINFYIFNFYLTCVSWILIGIVKLLKVIGLMKDTELENYYMSQQAIIEKKIGEEQNEKNFTEETPIKIDN